MRQAPGCWIYFGFYSEWNGSSGFRSKIPQTGWLKQQKILFLFLIVLGFSESEIGVLACLGSGEDSDDRQLPPRFGLTQWSDPSAAAPFSHKGTWY